MSQFMLPPRVEEEEFEVGISETTMESGNNQVSESVETGRVYDIHVLNQQQGLNQSSGRRRMTARMRVNTNYTHYRIQVPQILDEIEDEEEEEQVLEDDINEFMDQDMSQYFETRTHCAPPTMDDDEEEEQEACAICLFEYQDDDTIATLGCGHEFHVECIKKWLSKKKTCPFCRASVLPSNT